MAAKKKTVSRAKKKSASPKPAITLVTVGVGHVERALRFYEAIGFTVADRPSETTVFFEAGGTMLGIFPRHLLAEDAQVSPKGTGFGGVTLAWNVRSEAEVGAALALAERAGGKILKPAQRVFWGGTNGYFADPDGTPWEVAHNPFWKLDARGAVVLPKKSATTTKKTKKTKTKKTKA